MPCNWNGSQRLPYLSPHSLEALESWLCGMHATTDWTILNTAAMSTKLDAEETLVVTAVILPNASWAYWKLSPLD